MIAVQIENESLEEMVLKFAKEQKQSLEQLVTSALKHFVTKNPIVYDEKSEFKEITYTKLDVKKHIRYATEDFNELEDYTALKHIKDSALFIHNLRRGIK